jgi:hypothetical protein
VSLVSAAVRSWRAIGSPKPSSSSVVGVGRDPITGTPLGRAYPEYQLVAERVAERVADLHPALGPLAHADAVAVIEVGEAERGTRRAVAGYDFTFSVPKSASVLWAVADAGTQALIGQAHHAAVAEVVAYMEREVAATRTGATGRDGAVPQVDVTGLIATGYDHYDSQAGDRTCTCTSSFRTPASSSCSASASTRLASAGVCADKAMP